MNLITFILLALFCIIGFPLFILGVVIILVYIDIKESHVIQRYAVFLICLAIGGIYLLVMPDYNVMNSDTPWYIKESTNLNDTSMLPIGYPFLIRVGNIFGGYYHFLIMLQLIMFAFIMQAVYWIRERIYVLVFLLISGAYFVYIPYIMSDLTFSFFVVWSYYALIKKKLGWHIALIGLASLFRPTVAYFFVVEPFLVWFTFRSKKLAIWSFFLCFLATSFSPLKNLIDNGHFMHSTVLGRQYDIYLMKSKHPFLYPLYSIFSNSFSTHWFNTFRIFGLYKRDIGEATQLKGSNLVLVVHYIFLVFYAVFYPIFLVRTVRSRNWVALLWVLYFTSTCVFCHALGGRHRLSFEFLIY
jgi:hypothetical protein